MDKLAEPILPHFDAEYQVKECHKQEVIEMPIYEYQCNKCGQRFEVRQSMGADSSGLNCPECSSRDLRRLFSSFFSTNSSATEFSDSSCPTCSPGVCGLPPM